MNPGNNFSIKVEMIGCECSDREYSRSIYLFLDNQPVDSVDFFEYKPILGTGYYIRRNAARFKNLKPGKYSISYHNYYKQDSTIDVTIGTERITEIQICHDLINPQTFEEQTALDKLHSGDTLFINSYKSAGEFGGFDEGFWIWKSHDKVRGAFFYLAESYGEPEFWESRISFYKRRKKEAQFRSDAFELTNEHIKHIRHFLIETKYYPTYKWLRTNAPDFLTIYSRTDTLERINKEWNCNAYLELREKLTPADNR